MTRAFALGNGKSRQAVKLKRLREFGQIYGCNAIFEEFVPDVLISTDSPISQHIQKSGYSKKHRHYTRRPLEGYGSHKIKREWYGWSSGPIAAAYAAEQARRIYLLGYDLGGTTQGLFNNIYADTEFYKKSTDKPTFSGNWIKQLAACCKEFSDREFIRVIGEHSSDIDAFQSIPNLTHMPMTEFLDRLNNTKDL